MKEKYMKKEAVKLYGLGGKQNTTVRFEDMELSIKYDDPEPVIAEPIVKTSKLSFTVNDEGEKGIAGATVKLIGTKAYLSRPTGSKGGVTITDVENAIYELNVTADGYKFKPVPQIEVNGDNNITVVLEKMEG